MRPKIMKNHEPIKLKLGIKSSFPKARNAIALIIALWNATSHKSNIAYSKMAGDGIEIDELVYDQLLKYFNGMINDKTMFQEKINSNPLFKTQMEPIKVAFELVWRLCRFEFKDNNNNFASERTGNKRYEKVIYFTKNMDIIRLLFTQRETNYRNVLYSWITEDQLDENYKADEGILIKALTVFSEEAIYRLRIDSDKVIIFMNYGIYSTLVDGSEFVDATDKVEAAGSLRILHSLVSENLNAYIKKHKTLNGHFILRDEAQVDELREYINRIDSYLSLTKNDLNDYDETYVNDSTSDPINHIEEKEVLYKPKIELPYNRIVFGAPGTGKSYILEKDRQVFRNNYERVTFHPSYTYSQFVGTYKPKPKSKVNSEDEYITYEYIIGPFMRIWIKAMENPQEDYALVIEEINRANVAGVFGDIFQLLDRKVDGSSEYPISTNEDLRNYLINEKGFASSTASRLALPPNLYLWATMNSADQGVYPMDTAFKRRWHFDYIGIDDGEDIIQGKRIRLKPYGSIEWNFLRKKINSRLNESDLNINEDKQIGPFFIDMVELSSDKIDEIFKSKLLLYLFEDVLKHRKGRLFKSEYNTFSKIINAYDQSKNIFEFEVVSDKTASTADDSDDNNESNSDIDQIGEE